MESRGSCGCAVISTRVGFVKEYIQNGENGLFFPHKDVYMLSRLLKKLLDNKELRVQLGKEARKTVSEGFSWHHTLKTIRYLLKEELAARQK